MTFSDSDVSDERVKPVATVAATASTPPPPAKTPEQAAVAPAPLAAEAKTALDLQPAPPVSAMQDPFLQNVNADVRASPSPPPALTSPPPAVSPAPEPEVKTSDTVDAPVPPEASPQKQEAPREASVAHVEPPRTEVEKTAPEKKEKEPEPLAEKPQPVSDSALTSTPDPEVATEETSSPAANGSEDASAEATPTVPLKVMEVTPFWCG